MPISYAEYMADANREQAVAYDTALHSSTDLSASIRRRFQQMRDHRDTSGVTGRLQFCQRAVAGVYSNEQLGEILRFGGSQAYARITPIKCRTAAALLADIFTGADRPWSIEPTPEPTLPEDIHEAIKTLALSEAKAAEQAAAQGMGPAPTSEMVTGRLSELLQMAMSAAKNKAEQQAKMSTLRLDDILVQGGFYSALKEFLVIFTQYPIAILKGPYFELTKRVKYVEGMPTVVTEPTMCFSSPSPFDVWFSPGVSRARDGDVIERLRMAKTDLEAMRDIPGYNADAINAVLYEYPDGHSEWTSSSEQSRADMDERESPLLNSDGLYDVLEFHGFVDGATLANEPLFEADGLEEDGPARHVTVRLLCNYIISAQLNPDPMERTIYDTAGFEEVPGSVYKRALPEIVSDFQSLGNAALRAIINNMGLSSGPQVGLNLSAMSANENSQDMYPWKRWFYNSDPAAPTAPPIMFFQPQDNSQSMLAVLNQAWMYADEVSGIPRYAGGSEKVGGAGRTASGLAMLMGNVSRVFSYTASNIDVDVLERKLSYLYDMQLLTDTTGMFRGDETIRPRGAAFAAKSEVERTRALEFLQLTANPIDLQIVGPQGRAMVLSEVAEHLGFDHRRLALAMQAQASMPQQMPGQPPEGQPGTPGNTPAPGEEGPPRVNEGLDNAQRTQGAG